MFGQKFNSMLKLKLTLLLALAFVLSGFSQSLTVTSTGDAGPLSGTNWSISGNTLTVSGTASILASVIETALTSGSLSIVGSTSTITVTVNETINVTTGGNNLNLGADGNSGNIEINQPVVVNGAFSVYGEDIAVNKDLNTFTAGSAGSILLKSSGKITQAANVTVTANNASIVYWSNSDGGMSNGAILLRNGSSVLSNGGHIWIGGGSGTTTWNGLNVGDGFAVSGLTAITPNPSTAGGVISPGLYLEKVTLQSANGNIYLAGAGGTTNHWGITSLGANTIDAGSGTVVMNGGSASFPGRGAVLGVHNTNYAASLTVSSTSSASNAITIDFESPANHGSTVEGVVTFLAMNSGISYTSHGGGTGTNAGIRIGFSTTSRGVLNVLSSSGNITFNIGSLGLNIQNNQCEVTIGSKVGTAITSSTANIAFISDRLIASGVLAFATAGTLAVEPAASSFTAALNTTQLTYTGITGLTLGKTGNTANIVVGSPVSIAGPIALYGGELALNGTVMATNNTINLHATGSVTQTSAITANGLGLHGTGTFTLTNTGNNVGTIAGGDNTNKLGSLRYVDASGGLTIGSVNPSGITASGPVLIETLTGDITVSNSVITDDSSADAIIINAGKSSAVGTSSGGDIKISGSPTIMAGMGGIAKLFSGSEPASTGLTTLAGGSSNVRYLTDETTLSFSPSLQGDNVYALYRVASAPDAPTNLVATTCDSRANISFTAGAENGSPITNYEYTLNGGITWTAFSPSVTGTTVTVTNLTNGTVYNIQLRAVNIVGASATSTTVTVTINSAAIIYWGGTLMHTNSKSGVITLAARVVLPVGADATQYQLRFLNRDTGQPISVWLPVNLVLAHESHIGFVSHQYSVTLGSAETERNITIGFELDDPNSCFTRDNVSDNVSIMVKEVNSCGCN